MGQAGAPQELPRLQPPRTPCPCGLSNTAGEGITAIRSEEVKLRIGMERCLYQVFRKGRQEPEPKPVTPTPAAPCQHPCRVSSPQPCWLFGFWRREVEIAA